MGYPDCLNYEVGCREQKDGQGKVVGKEGSSGRWWSRKKMKGYHTGGNVAK